MAESSGQSKGAAALPLVLFFLFWAIYWPVLFFGLVNYDDMGLLRESPFITSLSPKSLTGMFTHFSIHSYYPVRQVSLALDYAFWGQNPTGFHLTNLLIHLANIFLLYSLVIRLGPSINHRKNLRLAAFLAACVFGFHPVVAETTAWIPGREELLTGFFLLWTLHFSLWAAKTLPGPLRWVCHILTAYAAAAACLSNVTGAVAPFFVLALNWTVLDTRKPATLAARTWYLWILAAGVVFIKMVSQGAWTEADQFMAFPRLDQALGNAGLLIQKSQVMDAWTSSPGQRVMVVLALFGKNISHLLVPLKMPIHFPNLPVQKLFSLPVGLGALCFFTMSALGWLNRKNRLAVLGLLLFVFALLPSSQVWPHHIQRADRFLYLPLMGWGVFLAALVARPGPETEKSKTTKQTLMRAAFCLYLLFLAIRLVFQLFHWSDPMALHTHSVAMSPGHFLPRQFLAEELSRSNRFDEALEQHIRAAELAPPVLNQWNRPLNLLLYLNRMEDAEMLARERLAANPDDLNSLNNLAMVLGKRGKFTQSIYFLEVILKKSPEQDMIHYNMAHMWRKLSNHGQAEFHFQKALEISDANFLAHYELGQEKERQGDLAQARMHYRKTLQYAPGFSQAGQALERLSQEP